jgi:hypothetical protein
MSNEPGTPNKESPASIPTALSKMKSIISQPQSSIISEARSILRKPGQQTDLDKMQNLANHLKAEQQFSYARRIVLGACKTKKYPGMGIPWEINLAIEERKPIIAMRFKDTPNAITPGILSNNGIVPFD